MTIQPRKINFRSYTSWIQGFSTLLHINQIIKMLYVRRSKLDWNGLEESHCQDEQVLDRLYKIEIDLLSKHIVY